MSTAIVTGGAKGIGRSIVEKLLKNGYKVLILDFDKNELKNIFVELEKLYPNNISYKVVNLKMMEDLEDALKFIKNNYKDISLLVNNAGAFPSKSMFDITENDWDEVHDLNLKSLFFITQGITKLMIINNEDNCNVINITSTASEIARPGVAHYASSKAGVKMLTEVMSLELASFHIRVNSVGPGLVETDSLLNTLDNDVAIKEHKEKISYYPLKRPATVNEISDVVLFIASEKASFVNGQNILVDGGYSAGKIYQSLIK